VAASWAPVREGGVQNLVLLEKEKGGSGGRRSARYSMYRCGGDMVEAPLVGDGIVPGMRSVQLLLETWDKPGHYREAVLGEFHWMKDERRIIDRLRKAEGVGIRDARVLRRNSQRMGMRVGLMEAIALLRNLR
jgi:hypothetical protein